MKKICYIFFLISLFGKINAQVNVQKLIEYQLTVVENYLENVEKAKNGKDSNVEIKNFDKAFDAAKFLEELTGIKSDADEQFDRIYEPSRENLKNWKAWYWKNKKALYWNEKEKKISMKK